MRIWSLHPKFLDSKGLVACWRESLLAKNVLMKLFYGEETGYKNHSQLIRFKNHQNPPVMSLNHYLYYLHREAESRGFNFDESKVGEWYPWFEEIPVTIKQVEYELKHLLNKLYIRDKCKYIQNAISISNLGENIKEIQKLVHPIFKVVNGEIESWEKV